VTYYGEEIGMSEVFMPAKNALDPIGQRYKWAPQFLVNALDIYVNRDGCRTPMQWDDSANAGFCDDSAHTWLPVHENYRKVNVTSQLNEADSLLRVYRELLHLRRQIRALREGSLQLMDEIPAEKNLLIYRRDFEGDSVLVVINFGNQAAAFRYQTGLDQTMFTVGMDVIGKYDGRSLAPYSGVILGSENVI